MKWGFRWYGENQDSVPIEFIKQIPGINGIIGTLINKLPGEKWEIDEILELKNKVELHNLELLGIESVAVHDSIKAGTSERDYYIENYIETIKNLSRCGIHLICYSFKPIFGWARTNLSSKNEDGSFSMLYDQKVINHMEASEMYTLISNQSGGFKLPGWEKERLDKFYDLSKLYEDITEEDLFENLKYFLLKIIPVCEEYSVKMAIHPDDPPWEIFNYPRITKNLEDLKKITDIIDSPSNGITFCSGSLGASPNNDLEEIIFAIKDKINFVHLRNIEYIAEKNFRETAHLSEEGSLDLYSLMKKLIDIGYTGVVRPDHGRTIWDEKAMPGYGLNDRALGLGYLQGLHEAIKKSL